MDDPHCMAHDSLVCQTSGAFGKRILITSGTIPHLVQAAQGGFVHRSAALGQVGATATRGAPYEQIYQRNLSSEIPSRVITA